MKPSVIVWDLETVPDLAGERRLKATSANEEFSLAAG
jgi:hypothetical protein